MSSQTAVKPLVLVMGGSGNTGQSIIGALLEHSAFRVASLTRPASAAKPTVMALKSKGVEIRLGDFARDSEEQSAGVLSGVDILISCVSAEALFEQKIFFIAAKKAGVKRIVPADFGTSCPSGVRAMHDQKLAIRSFVRDLGVPYTFIDVGWWMQLLLPHPIEGSPGSIVNASHDFFGQGNVKTAVTDLEDIGRFVARVLEDPRTVNQYVFCWGEHVTLNETYQIAERVSGQKLGDMKVPISDDEALRRAIEAREECQRNHDFASLLKWTHLEYVHSIFCRGDNTLEKAKVEGALDAKDLYPDFKARTLDECAKDFYANPPQFYV